MVTKDAFLAWCIWSEHNKMVFQSKSTPNSVLMAYVD